MPQIDEEAQRIHHRNTERIVALGGVINEALSELLDLVAEVDRSEGFFIDGSAGMRDWLTGTLRVTRRTAGTWVRAARRFEDYPAVRRAMRDGRLNLEQALALMRSVEPDDIDELLVDSLAGLTAEELHHAAHRVDQVSEARARADRDNRWHRSWYSDDFRFYHYQGKLPAEEGVIVETAIDHLSLQAPKDPGCGLFREPAQLAADAVVQMASESLGSDANPDRATVVVHVDQSFLTHEGSGMAATEFGPSIFGDAARRMMCDGRIQLVAHATDGTPIGVGRAARRIPYWLERLVRERDEGCRFPGCGRTRWTNVHHIEFWSRDNGRTDLPNLVTLCGFHHRLVHDEGWTVQGDPSGSLRWRHPRGGSDYTPPDDPFNGYDGVARRLEETTVESKWRYIDRWARHFARSNAPP